MIIQCEQCRTKFKLDDSRVPDTGAKVRCAKCRNVFSVAKELPETSSGSDFESMLETSTVSADMTGAFETEVEETTADETPLSAVIEEETLIEEPAVDEAPVADEDSFGFGEVQQEPLVEQAEDDGHALEFDTSGSEDLFPPVQAAAVEETPLDDDALDFGSFSFNEEEPGHAVSSSLDFGDTPKVQPPSEDKDFGGLDFSDDDMFGAVKPATDEDDTAGLDFGMDDFASSMGVDDTAAHKGGFAMGDAAADSPFSLDEIDFGDELTSVGVQHVNPEELKPSQEILFAPLAEAQAKPISEQPATVKPSAAEELPPLPIASRRKQSPFMNVVFAVFGVIVVAVLGIYGYSSISGGGKGPQDAAGKIGIQNVEAVYVKNKVAGELVVITGEAVNNFSKPRAAIKVRGLLYDANGDEITSKTAFGGNPLTPEQLASMPMDKIEAAMANQFGDSLANMEVAPGKAIQFVIVIPKPATGAKDFGVEPAGSTVSAVKQQ